MSSTSSFFRRSPIESNSFRRRSPSSQALPQNDKRGVSSLPAFNNRKDVNNGIPKSLNRGSRSLRNTNGSRAVQNNLISWLWSKPTVSLLYPLEVDPGWIIALIITDQHVRGKIIMIMTDQPQRINKYLPTPLPDNYILPYGKSEELEIALNLDSLIIIDQANPAQVRNMREEFSKQRPLIDDTLPIVRPSHLLILATIEPGLTKLERNKEWLTPLDQKEEISSLYFDLKDLRVPTLEHIKVLTKMTPFQEELFIRLRSQEIIDGTKGHNIRPNRKKIHVKNDYLNSNLVGNFINSDEDQVSSPKFEKLLEVIGDGKVVIFTHYQSSLDLIAELLDIKTSKKYNYITLTNKDDKVKKINEFNSSSNILLTTVIPTAPLLNVSQLHFIEKFNGNDYIDFLNKIYHQENYTQPIEDFKIYFHIAELSSKPDLEYQGNTYIVEGADEHFYDILIKDIEDWYDTYDNLKSGSYSVIITNNQMVVMPVSLNNADR